MQHGTSVSWQCKQNLGPDKKFLQTMFIIYTLNFGEIAQRKRGLALTDQTDTKHCKTQSLHLYSLWFLPFPQTSNSETQHLMHLLPCVTNFLRNYMTFHTAKFKLWMKIFIIIWKIFESKFLRGGARELEKLCSDLCKLLISLGYWFL